MFLLMQTKARAICLGLLVAWPGSQAAWAAGDLAPTDVTTSVATFVKAVPEPGQHKANFEHEDVSQVARQIADWVVDSGDNQSLPFIILDKIDAKVFVFHADGRLRGAAAALIGLAVGDDSVPGIGERKLSTIRPEERITPAGRFVAALDRNLHGKKILWVDYDSAISLHPVITSNPTERRAQRLATPSPLDKRISYGCINVPAEFFRNVVSPAFAGSNGIVYVLPETKSAREFFGAYDIGERARSHRQLPSDSLGLAPPTSVLTFFNHKE